MTTGPRQDGTSQPLKTMKLHSDGAGLPDPSSSGRDVDERTAVYLLSLARELLRRDHSAIANMIDYAIAEIETSGDDAD